MTTVRIYTTSSCPYCHRALALLRARGVTEPEEVRIDTNPAERGTMVQLSGRRTVPQIFIDGVHVGGCDDLVALDERGGLVPMLAG